MPTITTTTAVGSGRRSPHEVLGVAPGSGSPRGATYWRRVLRCPREHALATIARIVPERTSEALSLGWAYHQALEAYYRAVLAWHGTDLGGERVTAIRCGAPEWHQARAEAQRAAWRVVHAFEREPGYEEFHATLSRAVAAYLDVAAEEKWAVLAVEETLAVVRPAPYTARLDLVAVALGATPEEDVTWVVEHKTARGIGADTLSGYQLDLQTLGQAYLWTRCVDQGAYPPCRGVKVAITSKAKTPQHIRVDAIFGDQHLEAFEWSLEAAAAQERALEAHGYAPNFSACAGAVRGYSRCAYYDLCFAQPRMDVHDIRHDDLPPGFMVVADVDTAEEER